MRSSASKPFFLIALLGALFFTGPSAVHGALLSIQPAVTRLTMVPGQTWTGVVRVTNTEPEAVFVQLGSLNVRAGTGSDEATTPIINEPEDERAVSLAGWMELPVERIRLDARSVASVPVSIEIPPYAGHGVHRAVVTFRQEGQRAADGGARVAATITAGFAVEVIGTENSNHDLRIVDFSASSFMVSQFPVDVRIRMENRGTTLGVLDGSVEVDSLIGWGGVAFEVATPQEGRYLLPGNSYENTFELSDSAVGSRAGVYRARVSVENGGNVLEDSAYFVVVPMTLAAGLFLVIILSAILIRLAILSRIKGRKT